MAATGLAFDEGVIGLTGLTVNPALLTPFGRFGAGNDPDEATPADDVDDLHGVTQAVTVRRDNQAGREIRFTVTYSVRYVLPDAPGTLLDDNAPPTTAKVVIVNVAEEVGGEIGRVPVTCTLSQVITPAWNALHG